MRRDKIIAALRLLKVETGSVACLGCGMEQNCGIHGCRIMREAGRQMELDAQSIDNLRRKTDVKQSQLHQATAKNAELQKQNQELRDAAAQVTRLAAEAAAKREWISVEDRLPEVWRDEVTGELVNYMIHSPYFGVDIGNYHAGAKTWLCVALPCTVTHWMPLPEPPKEVEE